MPVRATKRGAQRTPLSAEADILICGASFAGLACARELAGSGARVLIVDRYEIGERQTSACAAPTEWLVNLGLERSIRQTFGELVVNTPRARTRWTLPWTFSTFDYRELCAALYEQTNAEFDTAKVEGVTRGGQLHVVHTDRGDLRAPLVVDALGWRRVLGADMAVQPPDARLSRGLEVHPDGRGDDLELWIDPAYVRAGYSWRFPAGDELRIGVGSFEPRDHVKEPTVRLAEDLGADAERFQGNWIPHRLRDATNDGIFFAGDSAGHCLPLTAEGIRTALYFGLACGRELRHVVDGRQSREQALERYGAFSADHAMAFRWLLGLQHGVGRITRLPLLEMLVKLTTRGSLAPWFFGKYLAVAPPDFALAGSSLSDHARPHAQSQSAAA